MTAKVSTKPVPKWKLWLRRANRPLPFWRKRMDDRLSDDYSSDDGDWWGRAANSVFTTLLQTAFTGVFVAFVVPVLIAPIFFSPGFWKDGLADPIGRGLAQVCMVSGNCDLRYLMSGAAVAAIFLYAAVAIVVAPIYSALNERDDEEEVSESELLAAVGALDERVVHLRADLVLAGVLPLSPEEKAEQADAG